MKTQNVPVNPGNPYLDSETQNCFGTFGPPDFCGGAGAGGPRWR